MISKKENANHSVNFISWKPQRIQPTEPVFFDYETFKQTLQHYEDTMFIQNLFTNVFFPFEVEDVTKVIQLYRLGTVAKGYRAGAISFPFIDLKGNIRTVFQSRKYIIKGSCVSNCVHKEKTTYRKKYCKWLILRVGATGFEPVTPCL